MPENDFERLLRDAAEKAPDMLWEKIRMRVAKGISEELLAKLDGQKAPCKQESIDRVNAMMADMAPKESLKRA